MYRPPWILWLAFLMTFSWVAVVITAWKKATRHRRASKTFPGPPISAEDLEPPGYYSRSLAEVWPEEED